MRFAGWLRRLRDGSVLESLLVIGLGAILGLVVGLVPMIVVSLGSDSRAWGNVVGVLFIILGASVVARIVYRVRPVRGHRDQ